MDVKIIELGESSFKWVAFDAQGNIIEQSAVFLSYEECAANAARQGHRVITPPPAIKKPSPPKPPPRERGMEM